MKNENCKIKSKRLYPNYSRTKKLQVQMLSWDKTFLGYNYTTFNGYSFCVRGICCSSGSNNIIWESKLIRKVK